MVIQLQILMAFPIQLAAAHAHFTSHVLSLPKNDECD